MNFHGVINERKIESAAQKVTGLERVSDELDGCRASLPVRSSDPAGGRHLLVAGAVAPSPRRSLVDGPVRGGSGPGVPTPWGLGALALSLWGCCGAWGQGGSPWRGNPAAALITRLHRCTLGGEGRGGAASLV